MSKVVADFVLDFVRRERFGLFEMVDLQISFGHPPASKNKQFHVTIHRGQEVNIRALAGRKLVVTRQGGYTRQSYPYFFFHAKPFRRVSTTNIYLFYLIPTIFP